MLRTSGFGLLACMAVFWRQSPCSCREYSPCEIEEVAQNAEDITAWGTRVGDDMARLLGPYQGTWRWDEDREALDLEHEGAEVPATATIELDPATYRLLDPHHGAHTVCFSSQTIAADGTMTFTDEDGEVITSFDLTVSRDLDYPFYVSDVLIQPVEAFSDEVHPLREWDVEGIDINAYWSEDGSELSVEVVYGAQSQLTPTAGHGTFAAVATFTTE